MTAWFALLRAIKPRRDSLCAAARLNIPTIVVACGYQPSGKYNGEHFDIEDLFINVGHYAAGRITLEELTEMSDNAVLGPGVCPGMGTANSMHCVTEAMGMALPGSTPVLANTAKMWQIVRAAGERIVQMVWEDVKPRDILTPEAFANGVMMILAVSGSINTIKHLQAIAKEAMCDVDVYDLFEKLGDKIPLLTAVRPNGEYLIEDFEAAGGTPAMMKQLEAFIHKGAKNVSGQTMGEILSTAKVLDDEVIRPVERALSWRRSIVFLRGSIAADCGIVKLAVAEDRPLRFNGPAVVYDSREMAIEGIKNGDVRPGQVLVLKGFGVKGNPGMGLCSNVVFALDGAGLTGKVAMITDGTVSGLCNKTLLVCEISPEAAEGGTLAIIENGDSILIDVEKGLVDLEIPKEELAERLAHLPAFPQTTNNGWLSIYQRLVKTLPEGAILTK